MKQPDSPALIAETKRIFGFLRDHGFTTHASDRTSTPLMAGVYFRGKNVAVSLGLDRRDECVDWYVSRVTDGQLARSDVPGGYWGHLHAFLVKHGAYRGGLKELRDLASEDEWRVSELTPYAKALKQLDPDIVTDSEGIFDETIGENA